MLTIGLTGGIGSGKSTVATLFAALGVPIIDTDEIARDVVQPGTAALAKIVDHFGADILLANGQLNRQALAQKIFQDASAKTWLEALLHPIILEQANDAKHKAQFPYCIQVIPLLIETLPNPNIDRILVVDAPPSLQIKRALARDPQRTSAEIQAIMNTQATREARLAAADDVIINDDDLTQLQTAVNNLHQKYLQLA